MDIVDRTYEYSGDDSFVLVTLADGFTIDFWLVGLTDEEYISRAKAIQKIEKE